MDMKEQNNLDFLPEKRDYESELIEIVKSDINKTQLKEKLSDYHDNDIAQAYELLTLEERDSLYDILGADELADIFAYLDDVDTLCRLAQPTTIKVITSSLGSIVVG